MYSRDVSRASVYFMNNYIDFPIKTSPNIAMGLKTPWYSAYETNQNESHRLAQLLIQELYPFYDLRKVILLDESPRPGRLAVLRGLTMPGVLIELGNLNHSLTARHLFLSEQIMNELVYELEQAISNYLYTRSGIQRSGPQN
jgi:N-acetylmuramoyl-L-alanine amidase